MSMSDQILALIRERRAVTFAELTREIEGFGGGDYQLSLSPNLVLWHGMTETAVYAVQNLMGTGQIVAKPTAMFTYIIDGHALTLPIAKRLRAYKEPHWIPVAFNPG